MGLSVMDYFKEHLKLQPAEMQLLSSFISFPWCIKLVYGLIADNVPIYGSKRKSYLVINGLLIFVLLLPLYPNLITNKYVITLFLTLNSMNTAFLNVVIDGLLVS